MEKKYNAFTLIEMLVVMGILIILMGVGIAAGRFASQRSQDIHHRDAAKELYTALLKYKGEVGEYPQMGTCAGCIEEEAFADLLGYNGGSGVLLPYLEEEGVFDGGTDATYYYATDSVDSQFALVCVSFGGRDDEMERGFYCIGDGLGALPEDYPVSSTEIESQESGDLEAGYVKSMDDSDWIKDSGFAASTN